jgi:glycosyltransferase involved in cell wall biosynthesis
MSVLNQTFPHFRVCVCDNASGDSTAEVVQEFIQMDSRVTYYCHPENIGAGANFNFGLTEVKTPFFSLLSDDDILLPEFYETTLEGFKNYPDAGFSAGSVISMTDKGQIVSHQLSSWPRYGYYEPPEGLVEMLGGKHPTWTGVLFRKEIIHEVGHLDLDVGPLADMDFELRVAARFPFVLAEKPCAIFVHHPSSCCSSFTTLDFFWPGLAKMIINLDNNADISLPIKIHVCRKMSKDIKRCLFGTNFILNRNFKDAYECAAILRRCFNDTIKSWLLHKIVYLAERNLMLINLLRYRDKCRRTIRKLLNRKLQKQYNSYTLYLESPSSTFLEK